MVQNVQDRKVQYQEVGAAAEIKNDENAKESADCGMSVADENSISGESDPNESIQIEDKYRLDLNRKPVNTVSSRPIEKKGSIKAGSLMLIFGSVILVVIWMAGIFGKSNETVSRSMPNNDLPSDPIDYTKAPKVIDYQAKYALKDQEVEIENFEKEKSDRALPVNTVGQIEAEEKVEPLAAPISPQPSQTDRIADKIVTRVARKPKPIAPIKIYAHATGMGGYGQISSTKSKSELSGESPQDREIANLKAKLAEFNEELSKETKNYQEIAPIGFKTTGILVDRIEGLDLQTLMRRKFIVKIKEHLTSPSGKIILEAGTRLVAIVTDIDGYGYLELTPTQIQKISQSTVSQIRPLTKNHILINAKNGGLLKAKINRPSTLPQDVLSAVFSGASVAAELFNRPESRSYSTYKDGKSETINNGQSNISVAAAGGFGKSMSEKMERRAELEKKRISNLGISFSLKAGTEVEIYVNEDFAF
ncbi:MAG: hypothetical protein QNJ38_23310 [Prochloraceae cyanobacterium]|nr:hypothetical protein [Prochloraceae cyanobacterium]